MVPQGGGPPYWFKTGITVIDVSVIIALSDIIDDSGQTVDQSLPPGRALGRLWLRY